MEDHDSNSKKQQDREIINMSYSADEDIFNHEEELGMDENGVIIEDGNFYDNRFYDGSEMDEDVPGSDMDDNMEIIGSEDEENNYWSLSDQEDHEEINEDLVD